MATILLQLLMPLMRSIVEQGKWVLWISPPHLLYAPALVQAGINTPRYPSLSKMLAAGKKCVTTLAEESLLSVSVSPKESLVAIELPEQTRAGQRIEGSLVDQVQQFKAFLQEKDLL
jgi:electron transfer flavoprotein alpha/beta subunit